MHVEELRRFLMDMTGKSIQLKINDNHHSIIKATPDKTGLGLRASVHRIFLNAPNEVLADLADFISKPSDDSRSSIRQYIHENLSAEKPESFVKKKLSTKENPKGKIYDLRNRADFLNRQYFYPKLEFRIEWMRLNQQKSTRKRRFQRQFTLGLWVVNQQKIKIHPILDSLEVPLFYLDFVIYHEMCHIVAPPICHESGRRTVHTREFYRLEKQFSHYRQAIKWQEQGLPRLMRKWSGLTSAKAKGQLSLF